MRQKNWMIMLAMGLLAVTGAVAQGPEDVGSGPIGAPTGSLTEIGSPTLPLVNFDFDALPAGPVTVADIQAAFTNGNVLADITTTPRNTGAGVYNFQTGGGRALGADPAGGGALVLLDPPAGAFDEVDDITVFFLGSSTEFGFEIGDWGGPFDVECFLGAASVGRVTVDTTGDARQHYVQAASPFDNCLITALPANPAGNWVVPSFQIPEEAVPVELQSVTVE